MHYRVWHTSQLGRAAFIYEVSSLEHAVLLYDALQQYDKWQEIPPGDNAGGVQSSDDGKTWIKIRIEPHTQEVTNERQIEREWQDGTPDP